MANTKEYKIVINGIQESINAVESLNKQLTALEQRINALQAKSVNISAGGTKGTSKSALSEEEKLARQIEQIDAKREAYSKKIYQNYLAAKDVLNETVKDQKEIAASERLQANNYTNTMKGLKEKLADIKNVMQTTDIGSDIFKKYTQEANAITQKLKELEEAYGQFGRNVGNYKSAADGFNKIKVAVGDTVREYDNYRQAMKALTQERFQLSQSVGQEAKAYKDVDIALKKLQSDYQDLDKSSAFMDNLLDTMQGFTSIAGIGVGMSSLFGIDDSKFNDSMQKLTSLLVVLKSIESFNLQLKKDEGLIAKVFNNFSKGIDKLFSEKKGSIAGSNMAMGLAKVLDETINLFDKLKFRTISETKALKEMLELFDDPQKASIFANKMWPNYSRQEKESQYILAMNWKIAKKYEAQWSAVFNSIENGVIKTFKVLSKTLLGIFTGGLVLFLPEIIEFFGDFVKSLDKTKNAADSANRSLNELNRSLEKRMDILGSSYMKGQISSEEYLKKVFDEQTAAIEKQIEVLQKRADAAKDNGILGTGWFKSSENTDFSGKKMSGATAVSSGFFGQLEVVVDNIEDVEKAWEKCVKSIEKNNDYLTENGSGAMNWIDSLFATVKHTEDIMKGMGNIKLSDTVAQFQNVTKQLNEGKITTDQYAKELAKLRDVMNNNEILNSVIANLDKYIPDEEVRQAVQNIINKIYELDDAFNMTSAQQVHHWEQVRIDAMKDGLNKTLEQIKENERYEIQQEAKTQKQRLLIEAKYERQRQDAREKAAKENLQKTKDDAKKLQDAENQLIAIRIENMKAGFDKRMKELDNQKRLELQKLANDAKDNKYIKVQEMTLEIEKKYDKLKLDEKRKWAYDTLKVYEDLANRIDQLNASTMETEAVTATQKTQTRQRKSEKSAGYEMITPTSYDDTKALEQYYEKVVEIKKQAAERELEIERERLAKAQEYEKKEEELRHSRLINADGGEYVQQLRAGLITQEQYDELIEKENLAHTAKMNAIDKQYASNLESTTQDTLEEVQKLYSDKYGNIINNLRSDKAKADEIMSKQPVVDKQGWGVVNTSKTSDNYKKALEEYEKVRQEIVKKQQQLSADLKAHRIDPQDFAMRQKELDQEVKAIDNAVEGVKQRQKELISDFMQSIQQYIQAGVQSFNDIMGAIWDVQDNNFDKEQEQLDKLNETLDKKLDEQQDIIEKHKDVINSIEDELSTARGDRRQRLIDQLNAEMAAQREAAAQEKKIQKQKEAQQKKQDDLDKKRKKAQYERDMMQAVVNGAMAVTYAAVNAWPIPAIPMMALAAATTATQIALMASNKPYAKGGQLDGPSHRDGGIKVPGIGGGIELEGQEYVIRKKSTTKNLDILDYINRSEKKLTLDDFIDFYGGKVRKSVSSMSPGRKFAQGGTLPTLRGDIDINDRLLNAFEDYSNRPVVVAVTEINEKQASVRNVQVLAGLDE